MIYTSDIKPKVMRLWELPATTELSPHSLKDAILRTWNRILTEMQMIDRNYFAAFSNTFTLNQDGEEEWFGTISIPNLSMVIHLEYGENGIWRQIDTVSIENWDYRKQKSIPGALISGHDLLSIRVNFDPSDGEFRLRYISCEFDSSAPVTEMTIPPFFSAMFEWGAAAECAPMITTDRMELKEIIPAKTSLFEAKFSENLRQFKDWLRAQGNKGITRRIPANARRRRQRWRI